MMCFYNLVLYFINSKLYSYPSIKDDSDINNIIYTLNDIISISVKYGFKMKKILLIYNPKNKY